jgi:hypothetical protein
MILPPFPLKSSTVSQDGDAQALRPSMERGVVRPLPALVLTVVNPVAAPPPVLAPVPNASYMPCIVAGFLWDASKVSILRWLVEAQGNLNFNTRSFCFKVIVSKYLDCSLTLL